MVDVESQFSSRKCSVVLDIIVYRIQRILSSDRHTIKPSGVLEVNEIRHLVIIRLGVDGQGRDLSSSGCGRISEP